MLARLSDRWGRVVILSGRPVAYLLGHLGGSGGAELFGLYGLERASAADPRTRTDPEAERWRPAVEEAAAAAERDAPDGVHVERKGLTVTVHFRNAPGQVRWVEDFAARTAARTGLAGHGGKMSVELRPPVDVDKGTVLRDQSAGLRAVLFAGDDVGDLPAFAELDRLRAAGVATLGVAAGSGETPPEVIAAADVVVDGPVGVLGLLDGLIGA